MLKNLNKSKLNVSIVTITLDNKKIKLSCPEESIDELVLSAEKLDLELSEIRQGNSSMPFELLLTIASLRLMSIRQQKIQESGGELLKHARQDSQKVLSSIYCELKNISNDI